MGRCCIRHLKWRRWLCNREMDAGRNFESHQCKSRRIPPRVQSRPCTERRVLGGECGKNSTRTPRSGSEGKFVRKRATLRMGPASPQRRGVQPEGDGGTEGESCPQCPQSRRMSFFSSCESQCRDSMYRVLRSGCGAEGKVSRQPERLLLASSRFPRVLSHR